jgi:hypothetical protein
MVVLLAAIVVGGAEWDITGGREMDSESSDDVLGGLFRWTQLPQDLRGIIW